MLCLVLTSVVFHATHALWAKAVDVCCVRVLFLWAVLRARRVRSLALLAALVLLCIHLHGWSELRWLGICLQGRGKRAAKACAFGMGVYADVAE